MKNAKLVLADDHPLMLLALSAILDHRYNVVGTCENGRDLVSLAKNTSPDVVVTDIDMPEVNGINAAEEIMNHLPEVKIIFYTAHTDSVMFRSAMSCGAHGYVVKHDPAQMLLTAIEKVLDGHQFFSESAHEVAKLFEESRSGTVPDLSTLTLRQLQILQLIGQGAQSKEIAHRLNLSMKTVEFHRANLTSRYGKRSIPELLLMALEQGLIHS